MVLPMRVACTLCRSSSASVVFPAPGGPWIRRTFPADSKKFEMRLSMPSAPARLVWTVALSSNCGVALVWSGDRFLVLQDEYPDYTVAPGTVHASEPEQIIDTRDTQRSRQPSHFTR